MKNTARINNGSNQESEKIKVQPPVDTKSLKQTEIYEYTEEDLNAKILKVTMTIQDEFPDLSKFLEEMPVTIPNQMHPDLQLKNLTLYYQSLNQLLHKYRLEHPQKSEISKQTTTPFRDNGIL